MTDFGTEHENTPPAEEEWNFSEEKIQAEDLLACYIHEYRREHPEGPGFPITWPFERLTEARFNGPFSSLDLPEREELKEFLLSQGPVFALGNVEDLLLLLRQVLTTDEESFLANCLLRSIPPRNFRMRNRIDSHGSFGGSLNQGNLQISPTMRPVC